MKIEIDQGSGFCFGVTRAINKAEEELAQRNTLYCLGDIVHNGKECDRLKKMGLIKFWILMWVENLWNLLWVVGKLSKA